MTLSDLSIKRPVFAWMLMLGLIVFGGMSVWRMGVSYLPEVNFPVIMATVTLEGAAPEVMETEVADVIEDAVMGAEGIKEVSSTSSLGRTIITIEFQLDRDLDAALQDVQTKVAEIERNLPRGIDPPVYLKVNPDEQPFMWLAASGGKDSAELMRYVKDTLKNQFTAVPGVGQVLLSGYVEPNLRVWLDTAKMRAHEITVQDVVAAIEKQHAEVPAGYIDTGTQELNVRVMGEALTVEQFENILIPRRMGGGQIWGKIRIKDIARVQNAMNDVRAIARNSGEMSVGIGIKKTRAANTVEVANGVIKKVEELKKTLPPGYQVKMAYDGTIFVREAIHELIFTLILSALLTSVVCYLFLGTWSSTLNVLLAIPTSILGAFTFMYFMGFTLNTFTVLGLSLAIGIVVDDAIMVLENIVRYKESGLSRVQAALVGAREITFPAMATTVAILAIFIPVVFMEGVIGQFFFAFGATISITVALSLLEALTLAPMRCSQFLQTGHTSWISQPIDRLMHAMAERYRLTLGWCLNHRWTVVFASLGIFVGSLFIGTLLKSEFVPAQDQGMLFMKMETAPGSSLAATDKVSQGIEQWLLKRPEVSNYYAAIGGFEGGEINVSMIFVTLHPLKKRPVSEDNKKPLTQQEMQTLLSETFTPEKTPGLVRMIVQDLSLSGFSASRGFPVEFTLRGPEWSELGKLEKEVTQKMKDSGLMKDIDSDYRLGQPEVHVIPNRDKASARGVDIRTIGDTVNATVGGVRVGKYSTGGRRYDVRVRLEGNDRMKPQDIRRLWVRNEQGEVVPLNEVTDLVEKPTLLSISRKNRERAISIFSNVTDGHSQTEALEALRKMASTMPPGYRIVFTGNAEAMQESFMHMMITLFLGIFIAYMVLAAQFNSFIHPFTVLMALPFSITGALVALWIGDRSLNLYSFIGIILLMGIVKKNSILLVDFTNNRREAGMALKEALLEACPVRLRPIIMTSVATIAAALPPAIGVGPGAETRIPMALVIIGGVAVSTLLTLFVVPCVYSLMSRFQSTRHAAALKEALHELGGKTV